MNFVHSFWSKPLEGKKFAHLEYSLRFTLVHYAYSVACIHKFGHTITLYTDEKGYEILKPVPYDKVIVLDNTITNNKHFAASIKFEALQRMALDEIIIDGDIFLEKPKVFDIIKNNESDLLVSLFEPQALIININKQYSTMFNNLNIEEEELYKRPNFRKIAGWYNTSVMKFNNEDFKQKHIEQYIKHVKQVGNMEFKGATWPDVIFEQYNLTPLSEHYGWSIDMINPFYGETEVWCWDIGFVHLGAIKKQAHNEYLCRLETLDNKLFKQLEQHLINLFKKYGISK